MSFLLVSLVGVIFVFLKYSLHVDISSSFLVNFLYFFSFIKPTLYPYSLSLKSALSCLSSNLYSAREVNILYGSIVPFVTKSSINTPIYASFLFSINGFLFSNFNEALIPDIRPWQAASSYPLVPFICPAVKRFSISFVSRFGLIWVGYIASYSIA